MRITVGGEKRDYEEGLTIAALMAAENVEMPEYTTVSVNEEFIDRSQFANTLLHEGDEVEFLYFMGGGC